MLLPAPTYARAAARSPVEREQGLRQRMNESCRTFAGPPASMKCGIEWDEWTMVHALVTDSDAVLELGGRFGTTSCALAAATGNSGRVVAVEPDERAWPYLMRNRHEHQCAFGVLRGIVGRTDVTLTHSTDNDGYASTTSTAALASLRRSMRDRSVRVPAMPLADVESRIGYNFTVLLIDCEGCIRIALTAPLAHQLKMILWEEDGVSPHVNAMFFHRLVAYGFKLHWRIRDSFDPSQAWSRKAYHSAWVRVEPGARRLPTCEEYRMARHMSARELDCTDAKLKPGSQLARKFYVQRAHFAQGARPGEYDHTCEYPQTDGVCPGYRGVRKTASGAWNAPWLEAGGNAQGQ